MLHGHHSTVEADADRIFRAIQLSVVGARSDHILHRAPRNRHRDERTHQEACDRGIAVGKVEDVRFLFFLRRKIQTGKTRVGKRAIVVALFIAGVGRNCFNPDTKEVMREGLEKRKGFRRQLASLLDTRSS